MPGEIPKALVQLEYKPIGCRLLNDAKESEKDRLFIGRPVKNHHGG